MYNWVKWKSKNARFLRVLVQKYVDKVGLSYGVRMNHMITLESVEYSFFLTYIIPLYIHIRFDLKYFKHSYLRFMNYLIRDCIAFTQNRTCSWGLLFLYHLALLYVWSLIIYHKEEATLNGFTVVVLSRFMNNRC